MRIHDRAVSFPPEYFKFSTYIAPFPAIEGESKIVMFKCSQRLLPEDNNTKGASLDHYRVLKYDKDHSSDLNGVQTDALSSAKSKPVCGFLDLVKESILGTSELRHSNEERTYRL